MLCILNLSRDYFQLFPNCQKRAQIRKATVMIMLYCSTACFTKFEKALESSRLEIASY